MAEETREFSPVRIGFMWPRIVGVLVLCAVLSVMVTVAALAVSSLLFLAIPVIWVTLVPFAAYAAHVAWTKETYEIHGDHLVARRGGLVSDGRNELDMRNITHVRLRLPWLRYRLFKIGDVRVESAGSAASEITFQSIVGPEEVYEEIQELMRANGFSLQRTEVLHEESPTFVGALTDIVQTGIGVIFSLVWMGFALLGVGAGALESAGAMAGAAITVLGATFVIGSSLLTLGGLAVRYLDLTRRTYTVHDDAVTYTEGFLTRDNAFIPAENIADASTNRTFIDQVLGLYDVKVSCQGSGSEIQFRRLSRGAELKQAISTVVDKGMKLAPKKGAVREDAAEDAEEAVPEAKGPGAPRTLVSAEDAWTATLKMNVGRTLVPLLLLLPTGPAWLIATVSMYIRATKTTFTVGKSSLQSEYSFIGANQQQFAYDKVTGVQLTRSPLDGFFKTLTVQIWSIGSPMPLTMSHISAEELNLPALLRQCGIDADAEAEGELAQSFGPQVWFIQNVFLLAFLAAAAAVFVVLGLLQSAWFLLFVPMLAVLPIPMAVLTYLRVQKQSLTFHASHVEARTGVLIRQEVYARYDNIKKVESVRIPLTDQGTFKLYIAGERVVQQQQQGQAEQANAAGLKVPYSLEGRYIERIDDKVDAMDSLLLGRIQPAQIDEEHDFVEAEYTTKPAIPNSIAPMLLFPPLWPFVPLVAWQTAVRQYDVEQERVVLRGGILFKFATSVLYNRIDSLQQDQGPLGKAFGNGQVTLLTAGSSSPDLVVANVPDYGEVYTTIREHYGK